ncbi:nicotinamide-nucleotide amidohydrolase family protein [Phycicoccus sp. 3266]|uniref:CinA family protein n=1 Tax=Phycicoccus sp. 3266 TaxID=2817751 RepID=UPI0028567A05|nr:nicotinamide-nucleotide amidohydrolase family protein [Phycicoccus sp. 3266]MDR6861780.1 nicotinamide-nucleotide amidase [Phycicoccus sp. 3266]
MTTGNAALATQVVAALRAAGVTVGTAESLTGGLVCGALTDVPGASATVRGAVVAYATELKAAVLGVDAGLLARGGAVQPEVAEQMARGVRTVLGVDVGVATTGVAGPDPQDGQPVGTVFVAVADADRVLVRRLALSGDRAAVRAGSVAGALGLVAELLGAGPAGAGAGNPLEPAEEAGPAGR